METTSIKDSCHIAFRQIFQPTMEHYSSPSRCSTVATGERIDWFGISGSQAAHQVGHRLSRLSLCDFNRPFSVNSVNCQTWNYSHSISPRHLWTLFFFWFATPHIGHCHCLKRQASEVARLWLDFLILSLFNFVILSHTRYHKFVRYQKTSCGRTILPTTAEQCLTICLWISHRTFAESLGARIGFEHLLNHQASTFTKKTASCYHKSPLGSWGFLRMAFAVALAAMFSPTAVA